jgi:hypothetical protein
MFTSCGNNLPETSALAIFLDALLLAGPRTLRFGVEKEVSGAAAAIAVTGTHAIHDCLYLLYAMYS